jgi:mannose-6-phosphate isomerase-like protein (cupin superfamily)
LSFEGLRIFDYTAGQSVRASVALIEVEPGATHKTAWSRRSDKYYLVLVGQITFVLDDVAHSLATGDFCLVKQGHRFSYSNRSSEPATLALVHAPSFDLNEEVFVEP